MQTRTWHSGNGNEGDIPVQQNTVRFCDNFIRIQNIITYVLIITCSVTLECFDKVCNEGNGVEFMN
jgi:hypothetical protein